MKLFHLSDLHLGRRLCELPLIEDQRHILSQILSYANSERPDAVLISGDIYDKPVPTVEAVSLFDGFLNKLSSRGISVLAVAGNHDSPERVGFGGRLMEPSGVYLAQGYDGSARRVTLGDEWGEVDFYLLPFIKPSAVRRFFPEKETAAGFDFDASAALECVIAELKPEPTRRSVLLAHQFVTGAERSDSEELSVGGADNVDAEVFAPFDYTALGHIHRPQWVGERIRYCGSPLKYSFSETAQEKSVTVVELRTKGELSVSELPLKPLHELVELRGGYDELTLRSRWDGTTLTSDYLHITLTDEDDIPEAAAKLRVIYKNLMKLDYDNTRTRAGYEPIDSAVERKAPLELFAEFFKQQNGRELSEKQSDFMRELIERTFEQ